MSTKPQSWSVSIGKLWTSSSARRSYILTACLTLAWLAYVGAGGQLTTDPSAAWEGLGVRNRDPVKEFQHRLLSAIFVGRDGLIDGMSIAASQL